MNYSKIFNEIDVNVLKINDTVHQNLRWYMEEQTSPKPVGEVDFNNIRKYTAIYTDDKPSYCAVLKDDNAIYARIPIYSYTYTQIAEIDKNKKVFVPLSYIKSTEMPDFQINDIGLPVEHKPFDNRNYITTYSNVSYDGFVFYPDNTNDYGVGSFFCKQNIINHVNNVHLDYFTFNFSYDSLVDGNIINNVTDYRMGYFWEGTSKLNDYSYFLARNSFSWFKINENVSSGMNGDKIVMEPLTLKTYGQLYDGLQPPRELRASTTDYYGGINGFPRNNNQLVSYFTYAGLNDNNKYKVNNNEIFSFDTKSYIYKSLLFGDDETLTEYGRKIKHLFIEPDEHNNAIGITLRSYCDIMENRYKDETGQLPSSLNCEIIPAKLYDHSINTYEDTHLFVPFNVVNPSHTNSCSLPCYFGVNVNDNGFLDNFRCSTNYSGTGQLTMQITNAPAISGFMGQNNSTKYSFIEHLYTYFPMPWYDENALNSGPPYYCGRYTDSENAISIMTNRDIKGPTSSNYGNVTMNKYWYNPLIIKPVSGYSKNVVDYVTAIASTLKGEIYLSFFINGLFTQQHPEVWPYTSLQNPAVKIIIDLYNEFTGVPTSSSVNDPNSGMTTGYKLNRNNVTPFCSFTIPLNYLDIGDPVNHSTSGQTNIMNPQNNNSTQRYYVYSASGNGIAARTIPIKINSFHGKQISARDIIDYLNKSSITDSNGNLCNINDLLNTNFVGAATCMIVTLDIKLNDHN